MRHHHHAGVDEVIVFHDDVGEPDYLFRGWTQEAEEPCDCDLVDPFHPTTDEDVENAIAAGLDAAVDDLHDYAGLTVLTEEATRAVHKAIPAVLQAVAVARRTEEER